MPRPRASGTVDMPPTVATPSVTCRIALATGLLAENPFPGAPPQELRIQYYTYKFNKPWSGKPVWNRELIGTWLPPVTLKDKAFSAFIHGNGWE